MSIKTKALESATVFAGACLAEIGTRRMRRGTSRGTGLYAAGVIFEQLPTLIKPDNSHLLGTIFGYGSSVRAIRKVQEENMLKPEVAQDRILQSTVQASIGAGIAPLGSRFEPAAAAIGNMSVVCDVISDTLLAEGRAGESEYAEILGQLGRFVSASVLGRTVLVDTAEEIAAELHS